MKYVKMLIWGSVLIAGLLQLWAAINMPNFGLSMAGLGTWALGFALTSLGSVKVMGKDVLAKVEVL